MKRIIYSMLFALPLGAALPASAQESENITEEIVTETVPAYGTKVMTNSFRSNWFIQAGAGPQIMFGDHDRQMKFGDRISPALEVSFGKWFSPVLGVRFTYSGLQYKEAYQNFSPKPWEKPVPDKGGWGYWLYEQKINYMNLHVDGMLSLTNLIGGYNPSRVYDLDLWVGVGWAHVMGHHSGDDISANIGLNNRFHVGKGWDVILNIYGMAVSDRFDCGRDNYSNNSGRRPFNGIFSVVAGVAYNFAPRGWYNTTTLVNRTTTLTEVDNDAVNRLRNQLSKAEKENQDLRARLAKIDESLKSCYVKFAINSSKLTEEARVQLDILAESLKHLDPNGSYTVTGYADAATGTPAINERLSEARAEAVASYLRSLGISAKAFRVEHKGGVDNLFYNNPALSRCVIVRSK